MARQLQLYNIRLVFAFVALALQPGGLFAASAPVPATGIAMHGEPKYGQNFKHFDYVNPDAPQGGVLNLGVVGTFDSLNPFIVRGQPPQVPGFELKGVVYETLLARSWDEPFSLYGLIAESVEVPGDRSSVIFNLNPKARWQDGKPITADDVLFSFETLREQGRPNHRTYYKKVDKAEKLGKRRILFSFKRDESGKLDREMPLIMGLMPVLPKHEWKGRDFNQTTLRPPLGSGPYKVVKVDPGRSITYRKDPNYWGRDVPAQKGTCNFDEVRFDFYRDDSIALQAFKSGQFDLRRETNPKKWAKGYDSAALKDGRIKLARFEHHRPEAAYGFIFNARRPLFSTPVLRKAMSDVFNFAWVNRVLFQGMYRRTESYFPNSELAATGVPEGQEKNILMAYKDRLPRSLFLEPPFPSQSASDDERAAELQAFESLKKAGYFLKNDALMSPQGDPVAFEIMLSDPSEEKVALEWSRALKRIGIAARVRTVDSAQFQARMNAFDYDVTVGRWFNSLSPGNEQMFFWGSAAAKQNGSRNYPGVDDPVIDALASAIPLATTREGLVATTRALDRVLLAGHYIVPLYHLGADLVAYWTERVSPPATTPLYGAILETWWAKN